MGKLDHDPNIQHFSHPHPLELNNYNNINQITQLLCSACKYPPYEYMYSCTPCNFTLHLSCTKSPQIITHPSHPPHPLSLLPISPYPAGIFNCDACNSRGNGFTYHCHLCDFDLHVACASKPLSVTHQAHPHPITLAFTNPYHTKGFSCDICRKIGSKQWLYRCGACEFDAHLECATGMPLPPKPVAQMPPPLQHHHSFPGAAGGGNAPVGGGLMNVVLQGFVEGAAQQVGQNLVQSFTGSGSGGGNGGGNGDVSFASFNVDVGTSFTGTEDLYENQDYLI